MRIGKELIWFTINICEHSDEAIEIVMDEMIGITETLVNLIR